MEKQYVALIETGVTEFIDTSPDWKKVSLENHEELSKLVIAMKEADTKLDIKFGISEYSTKQASRSLVQNPTLTPLALSKAKSDDQNLQAAYSEAKASLENLRDFLIQRQDSIKIAPVILFLQARLDILNRIDDPTDIGLAYLRDALASFNETVKFCEKALEVKT